MPASHGQVTLKQADYKALGSGSSLANDHTQVDSTIMTSINNDKTQPQSKASPKTDLQSKKNANFNYANNQFGSALGGMSSTTANHFGAGSAI